MEMLPFTKMQGLGNDFVLLDGLTRPLSLTCDQIRLLANRRYGVGCDQVLVAEPSRRRDVDVRYRVFNNDGSEAEHCGNGIRCLARFLQDKALIADHEITVETANGLCVVRLCDDGPVTVDMGAPELEPNRIPFHAGARATTYPVRLGDEFVEIAAVSMGNPHAVLQVDNVDSAPVATLGPALEHHPDFPNRVNVGFMQILDPTHVRLRVHERSAGETLACGTGACAAVVAGRLLGRLGTQVAVDLPGGRLVIHWAGEGEAVWMTGPATTVFEGRIPLRAGATRATGTIRGVGEA